MAMIKINVGGGWKNIWGSETVYVPCSCSSGCTGGCTRACIAKAFGSSCSGCTGNCWGCYATNMTTPQYSDGYSSYKHSYGYLKVNVSNTWKVSKTPKLNVSGTWRNITN